jgi:predicted RNase H-like nuclease (RuvC/YqgF family)
MLVKYEVITLKSGTTDITRILNQYDLIQDEDYKLRNNAEFKSKGGRSNKNEYYLHPRAFKICLMRSRNEKKYARYYLLLEEAVKYYSDYQTELNKKYIIKYKEKINKQKELIIEKNDNINKLQIDIQQLIKSNEQLIKKNDETSNEVKQVLKINKRLEKKSNKMELQLNETLERLDITNYKLDETKDELGDTSEKLDLVAKKLDIATDDRVVKPKKIILNEYFVVIKNPEATYKYYIIRGQKRYINKKKDELDGYIEIKNLECVPNANILWNLVKEKLKGNDFLGNKLNLKNINEIKFLELVNNIYNERKNVNI